MSGVENGWWPSSSGEIGRSHAAVWYKAGWRELELQLGGVESTRIISLRSIIVYIINTHHSCSSPENKTQ
ncbi:hypothetical protein FJTKL_03907 [Diaporthe vaccinii]|uniref:Uncharacterized protein n=1 Tax=Diaporthe vaccinii TaxID=105482 RepID=A0ABR4F1I9_9PEZI